MRLVNEKPISKEDINITSAFLAEEKRFHCCLLQQINGKFIAKQEFESFYLISSERELEIALKQFIRRLNLQIDSGKICTIHNNRYKYYRVRKTLKINS